MTRRKRCYKMLFFNIIIICHCDALLYHILLCIIQFTKMRCCCRNNSCCCFIWCVDFSMLGLRTVQYNEHNKHYKCCVCVFFLSILISNLTNFLHSYNSAHNLCKKSIRHTDGVYYILLGICIIFYYTCWTAFLASEQWF